ncbi:MAG: four helix bundle protein [Candidatus Liptonbacteria bacterium]|nr:four helix bundle protein [Candidatus Liptonbacteria bacterium]
MTIIQRLISSYKLWQDFLRHFPKTSRYTLGEKIDRLFIEILELTLEASYLPRNRKAPSIEKAVIKLGSLKFFLQVAWEIKALKTSQYALVSEKIDEIGRMLGGWLKQILS